MTQDGARRQPAERAGGSRPAGTAAEERTRRAWAKPALQRISLQRTLALSGGFTDTHKAGSATPT